MESSKNGILLIIYLKGYNGMCYMFKSVLKLVQAERIKYGNVRILDYQKSNNRPWLMRQFGKFERFPLLYFLKYQVMLSDRQNERTKFDSLRDISILLPPKFKFIEEKESVESFFLDSFDGVQILCHFNSGDMDEDLQNMDDFMTEIKKVWRQERYRIGITRSIMSSTPTTYFYRVLSSPTRSLTPTSQSPFPLPPLLQEATPSWLSGGWGLLGVGVPLLYFLPFSTLEIPLSHESVLQGALKEALSTCYPRYTIRWTATAFNPAKNEVFGVADGMLVVLGQSPQKTNHLTLQQAITMCRGPGSRLATEVSTDSKEKLEEWAGRKVVLEIGSGNVEKIKEYFLFSGKRLDLLLPRSFPRIKFTISQNKAVSKPSLSLYENKEILKHIIPDDITPKTIFSLLSDIWPDLMLDDDSHIPEHLLEKYYSTSIPYNPSDYLDL